MRDRIARLAADNGRSMNSEIIDRLEKSFEADESLNELWRKFEELQRMVYAHDEELNPLKYDRD